MTGLSGLDVERMEALARLIDGRASTLDGLARSSRSGIAGSRGFWDGPDAGSFRQSWQAAHAPSLGRCVGDLREMAASVRRNVAAQQETSALEGAQDEGGGWGSSLRSFGGGIGLPGLPDLRDRPVFPRPGFLLAGGGVGRGWLEDRAADGWDYANDGVDWLEDQATDGVEWLEDQASTAWDWAGDRLSETWDDFTDWGRDRLGQLGSAAGDLFIGNLLNKSRAFKLIAGSGLFGTVAGGLFAGPVGGVVGGFVDREVVAPRLRGWWNEDANPWLVDQLFENLDGRIGGDEIPSGDLEARVPGGAFPVRESGDDGGPNAFTVDGGTDVDLGRNAIVRSLEDTADGEQIQADEFQVIAHENGSYTVVLPGVTDLSSPNAGLSEHNRSVRDTDWAATRSAGSASIADNRYARMVRDYIEQNVPPGSDLAIVGHSFGADTALDLAADPRFNGRDYHVTHVVAAAYYSEPQLPHVQDGTEVLVLQNTRDIPVVVEEVGHASTPGEVFPATGEGIVVDEFTGGWTGAGHHQDNYIDRVQETTDQEHEEFFASWAAAGYGENGEATAVDVSVHESEVGE